MFIDTKEAEELLKVVLPPVTKEELAIEVKRIMKSVGAEEDGLIDADKFLGAVLDNPYWAKAGPLVVKELIFLDCLFDYYHLKRNPSTLNDEDYSELKDMLTVSHSMFMSSHTAYIGFLSSGPHLSNQNPIWP
jgi:hypothetical protein